MHYLLICRMAVAGAILLVATLRAGYQAEPNSDVRDTKASLAASPPTVKGPVERSVFPMVKDFGFRGPPITSDSPVKRMSLGWVFAVGKLTVIVAAIFVWLGGLRLCAAPQFDDEAGKGQQYRWQYAFGFVGILTALLLPAYVPGACILLVTSTLPYWSYARARNKLKHARDEANSLHGKPYYSPTVASIASDESTTSESPAPLAIAGATSSIRLLTKAPLSMSNNADPARAEQSSPAFRHVLALLDHAVQSRATDLHLNSKGGQVELRQRIDGSLMSLGDLPRELGYSVINVFKVLSDLNIADRRRSQDGSFRADFNGRRLSFRVSSQGTQTGEKLSIRILDPAKTFSDLSSLGMPDGTQARFSEQLSRNHGLILIVGSTGAGKSTTACAALQTIDTSSRNIVSIEDPIEYQIPTVDQIEVNVRAGQTYESVLRSVLRLDADVIFIGEVRDAETARIACQAAQAGQLVLATMHANGSVAGATRLADWGHDAHSVADSLRAVLCQTLVRKLCVDCRIAYSPDPVLVEQLGLSGFEGQFYRAPDVSDSRCATCDGRGFVRRMGIYELTEINTVIGNMIRERLNPPAIMQVARDHGMTTLRDEAIQLICAGVISVEEFQRVLGIQ